MATHTFEVTVKRKEIRAMLQAIIAFQFLTFIMGVGFTVFILTPISEFMVFAYIVFVLLCGYAYNEWKKDFAVLHDVLKPYRDFYGPKKLPKDDGTATPASDDKESS